MAQMDGSSSSQWTTQEILDYKKKSYTFSTEKKYTDRNISLSIEARDGESSPTSGSVTGQNCTLSSTDTTSGVSIEGSGGVSITKSGWFDTGTLDGSSINTYITGVTVTQGKTFKINDGIYDWTVSVDSSGNVSIS